MYLTFILVGPVLYLVLVTPQPWCRLLVSMVRDAGSRVLSQGGTGKNYSRGVVFHTCVDSCMFVVSCLDLPQGGTSKMRSEEVPWGGILMLAACSSSVLGWGFLGTSPEKRKLPFQTALKFVGTDSLVAICIYNWFSMIYDMAAVVALFQGLRIGSIVCMTFGRSLSVIERLRE